MWLWEWNLRNQHILAVYQGNRLIIEAKDDAGKNGGGGESKTGEAVLGGDVALIYDPYSLTHCMLAQKELLIHQCGLFVCFLLVLV